MSSNNNPGELTPDNYVPNEALAKALAHIGTDLIREGTPQSELEASVIFQVAGLIGDYPTLLCLAKLITALTEDRVLLMKKSAEININKTQGN